MYSQIHFPHETCDIVTMFDVFVWNQAKKTSCDNVIFITFCINHVLANEIFWITNENKGILLNLNYEFLNCIKQIDDTLIKVHKPYNNKSHKHGSMAKNKIYSLNNIVVVDHHDMFIYLHINYSRSFHDVTINYTSLSFINVGVNTLFTQMTSSSTFQMSHHILEK